MKFTSSPNSKRDQMERRHQRVASWLNAQPYTQSEACTVGEYVYGGSPTNYPWLKEQVARLSNVGDRTIARHLIAQWEADAIYAAARRAEAIEMGKIYDAEFKSWLASLPAGAQYADARRGGCVAVLDGILIARFGGAGPASMGTAPISNRRRGL